MKCPVCTTVNLVMAERQGIEIDYCPECRGVWLDRGELDKIIERSGSHPAPPSGAGPEAPYRQPEQSSPQAYHGQPQYYRDSDHHGHGHGYGRHHKKKSFFSEIFDFD